MEDLIFIIAQGFGIVACIFSVISMLSKNITGALIFQMLGNIAIAINFGMVDGISGAVVCIIGTIQTLVMFLMRKKEIEPKGWLIGLFLIAYITAAVVMYSKWFDVLSGIAAVTFAVAVAQKKTSNYRMIMLVNSCLWIVFDFCAGAYTAIITHGIILASIIVGMIGLDAKKEK